MKQVPAASTDGTGRYVADVVGLVALNQLTGAFNLVAGLEPDETQESTGAATG